MSSIPRTALSRELHRGIVRAHKLYESRLTPEERAIHRRSCARVADQIGARLDGWRLDSKQGALRIATELPAILRDAVDPSPYKAKDPGRPNGYGKYLLYQHRADDGLEWCIQLFAFDPTQRTPIHNHPCSCGLAPLHGEIVEERFEAEEGSTASKRSELVLRPGDVAIIDPDAPNIHRLENRGAEPAVTAHLYLIDGLERAAAVKSVFVERG